MSIPLTMKIFHLSPRATRSPMISPIPSMGQISLNIDLILTIFYMIGVVLQSKSSASKNGADLLLPWLQPAWPQHVRIQPCLHAYGSWTGPAFSAFVA